MQLNCSRESESQTLANASTHTPPAASLIQLNMPFGVGWPALFALVLLFFVTFSLFAYDCVLSLADCFNSRRTFLGI